ncbi:MAG: HAMP domain-containing histidine kinase [Clostridia bacterium]|nr:HAMP domain-containing histidine kinase [Clostridia bacterium]
MSKRELKKYINKEIERDINERKTIQQKYKRYNSFMVLISVLITVVVVVALIALFDYQVLRPQDNRTNEFFTEKTNVVSEELAQLYIKSPMEKLMIEVYRKMDINLSASGISMLLVDHEQTPIYASEKIDMNIVDYNFKLFMDRYREMFIIEHHYVPDTYLELYFFIPKTDGSLMRRTFLIFLATIFLISQIFRAGVSHSIMKRVYKNIVEPLDKLKEGINHIRKGDYEHSIGNTNHYNREIKETFKDFEKMRLQLKENKELANQYEDNRKELISNISHDLKTPIASIIGYVEGILDGVANTPAKHDRYMQIIYKKALDLNRLVNDLILFSKLDVNKVTFNFKAVNFQTYIETLFEEFGIELRENGVELVSRYQALEDLQLCIDQKQLRRVFNNIIGNALKHLNKETKAIEIMVYEEMEEVFVRISDNGSGIPEDKVTHIFDRFYKGDVSRNTDIGSSGLGLSISKQIVEAHGGRIWATSELDQGTIIYFTLSKKERKNA